MVPRRPSSNRVYPTGTIGALTSRARDVVGLSHLKEAVAVDRGHRDGADLVVALDAELDEVAGAARPELLVELFLGGDRDAVDLQDPIALAEPGARGGPDGGELADEETRGHGDGVETEPRPRRPAGDPAGVDQLVLHRHELLDGDREVHVWGLAEPERRDPDQLTPVVHDGAAAPLRARRRHDDRAVEHVFPVRRESADGVHGTGHLDQVVVLVDAYGPGPGPGDDRARIAERRDRPRPVALELDDAEAGVEVEADHPRRHGAAVTAACLDLDGVQQQIAHREHVAPRVEDHAAAEAAAAEPRGGGGTLGIAHA